jgi:hypothetical protein
VKFISGVAQLLRLLVEYFVVRFVMSKMNFETFCFVFIIILCYETFVREKNVNKIR